MNSRVVSLWRKFRNKAFRDTFSNAQLATGVAAQIQTMREDRGLTQAELASATGMAQSRISLLEDPSYDRMSLSTLKRVASAMDVALSVKFIPHSDLLREVAVPSSHKFSVASFEQDTCPEVPSVGWQMTAFLHGKASHYNTIKASVLLPQSAVVASVTPRSTNVRISRAVA